MHYAHTQQMSSPYARGTAARPKKPSRPAAGVVLVVYIYYPQKIPPPEASDPPARCASVRPLSRTWLRAVTFSPFWRFLGDHHHHYHHQGLLSQWTARTLTLYTIFAIPPPSSGWIIAEKESQQHACLPPVACSRTQELRLASRRKLPWWDAALACPRGTRANYYYHLIRVCNRTSKNRHAYH
jgi:hypothetical protein